MTVFNGIHNLLLADLVGKSDKAGRLARLVEVINGFGVNIGIADHRVAELPPGINGDAFLFA